MFARYKIGDQVQTETPLFMHTGHEINLIIRFALILHGINLKK